MTGGVPGATAPTVAHSPLRPFRKPNFARLWVGSVLSAAGASVGSIIVVWLVYETTLSPLAISLLGIVQFLPTLAFGLLAGALIDRWDRRRLMLACDLARSICFGALALYVLAFGVSVAVLIGAVFIVATFSTVFRPATNAAIPRILDRAEVVDGNGLLQGGSTVAQFVGSPLGGLILLTLGAAVGLAFNALTFAVSGLMIFLMVIPAGARPAMGAGEPKKSLLNDVFDGLRYLRSQRALLIITATSMASNFFLTIWGSFTVIYVAEHLHQGAEGFAILVAANTAGFAIGSILPGRLHTERAPGLWLPATWGLAGFLVIGLAWTSSLAVAAGLSVIAGTLLSVGNTTWLSGVQRSVPDEFLGRCFATDEAGSFAMIPAGIAIGGVLVLVAGIAFTYVLAGAGALIFTLPLILSPSVRQWGRASPNGGGP